MMPDIRGTYREATASDYVNYLMNLYFSAVLVRVQNHIFW